MTNPCVASRVIASVLGARSTGLALLRPCSPRSPSAAPTPSATRTARREARSRCTSSAAARAPSSSASRSRPTPARCSSTCATTRRATRRISANNHPVRHGAVVGDPQRAHRQRRRADGPHGFERAQPGMTVDSEVIFAVAEATGSQRCAVRGVPRLDGGGLARRARAGAALPRPRRRPAALGRRDPPRALLRLDRARARDRRAVRPASACASGRSPRGRSPRVKGARAPCDVERFTPDPTYEPDTLPAVRAPHEGDVLPRRCASPRYVAAADVVAHRRWRRPRSTVDALLA